MVQLIRVVKAYSGGYWCIHSVKEMGVPIVADMDDIIEDSHWDVRPPK